MASKKKKEKEKQRKLTGRCDKGGLSFTHQSSAVVAGKILLAYLDEAPKSLL